MRKMMRRELLAGRVDLGSGVVVTPDLTEDAFLATPGGAEAEPFVINGPHRSYKLKPTAALGPVYLPIVYFSDGRIHALHLSHPGRPGETWADWSEASERALQKTYDAWLKRTLGWRMSSRTRWGSIGTHYDAKAGFSFIYFHYA